MTHDLRILYVDDDDDIRIVATMALQLDPGLEVRAVASGQAALAALDQDAWRPDVILMDVMMPGMNGFALHDALRSREGLGQTTRIFMTARASRAGFEEYVANGAHGVILKPFDPLTLASEVRAIANRPRHD